jgi:hypothetical protein
MQLSKNRQIILSLLSWIFTETTFKKLLELDPKGFFDVIKLIFKEERIKYSMVDAKVKVVNTSISNNSRVVEFNLESFLNFIEEKCRENKSEEVLEQFFEFIAIVSINFKLEKSLILETLTYLLKHDRKIYLETKDQSCDYDYIDRMNPVLIKVIDHYLNNLKENDLNDLLNTAEMTPLVLVKIKIMSLLKKYKRCLDVFFEKNHIKDKSNLIFEWIDINLRSLSRSQNNFFELKKEVLEKIPQLALMSNTHTEQLINKWFKDDIDKVIFLLSKVEDMQLEYVDLFIENNRQDIEKYMTNSNKANLNLIKSKTYETILELHIELLCKLKPNKV